MTGPVRWPVTAASRRADLFGTLRFAFSGRFSWSILASMTDVTLSPEQERFAAEIVARGRYRDVAEVVGAALHSFKRIEEQRAALLASFVAAEQEGEREGFLTIDEVMADADALLEELASTAQ